MVPSALAASSAQNLLDALRRHGLCESSSAPPAASRAGRACLIYLGPPEERAPQGSVHVYGPGLFDLRLSLTQPKAGEIQAVFASPRELLAYLRRAQQEHPEAALPGSRALHYRVSYAPCLRTALGPHDLAAYGVRLGIYVPARPVIKSSVRPDRRLIHVQLLGAYARGNLQRRAGELLCASGTLRADLEDVPMAAEISCPKCRRRAGFADL